MLGGCVIDPQPAPDPGVTIADDEGSSVDVGVNEFVVLLGPKPVVHQATGIVSVQIGAGLREAAVRLIATSTETGRSVESIACDVVDRTLRFD